MKDPQAKTKVVVRKLPPDLEEKVFLEALDRRLQGKYNWFAFYGGKISSKRTVHSRAYVNLNKAEQVYEFVDIFHGHVFVNERGAQYQAQVEFAPFQKIPKTKPRKDTRKGTIFKDSAYLEFIASLENPPDSLPSAEVQLERKEAERAAAVAAGVKDVAIVTPLMEFVRQKRAARVASQRPLPPAVKAALSGGRILAAGSAASASSFQAGSGSQRKGQQGKTRGDSEKGGQSTASFATSAPAGRDDAVRRKGGTEGGSSASDKMKKDAFESKKGQKESSTASGAPSLKQQPSILARPPALPQGRSSRDGHAQATSLDADQGDSSAPSSAVVAAKSAAAAALTGGSTGGRGRPPFFASSTPAVERAELTMMRKEKATPGNLSSSSDDLATGSTSGKGRGKAGNLGFPGILGRGLEGLSTADSVVTGVEAPAHPPKKELPKKQRPVLIAKVLKVPDKEQGPEAGTEAPSEHVAGGQPHSGVSRAGGRKPHKASAQKSLPSQRDGAATAPGIEHSCCSAGDDANAEKSGNSTSTDGLTAGSDKLQGAGPSSTADPGEGGGEGRRLRNKDRPDRPVWTPRRRTNSSLEPAGGSSSSEATGAGLGASASVPGDVKAASGASTAAHGGQIPPIPGTLGRGQRGARPSKPPAPAKGVLAGTAGPSQDPGGDVTGQGSGCSTGSVEVGEQGAPARGASSLPADGLRAPRGGGNQRSKGTRGGATSVGPAEGSHASTRATWQPVSGSQSQGAASGDSSTRSQSDSETSGASSPRANPSASYKGTLGTSRQGGKSRGGGRGAGRGGTRVVASTRGETGRAGPSLGGGDLVGQPNFELGTGGGIPVQEGSLQEGGGPKQGRRRGQRASNDGRGMEIPSPGTGEAQPLTQGSIL